MICLLALMLRILLRLSSSPPSSSWLLPSRCSAASTWSKGAGNCTKEELDLVEFLDAHVALLSSSLAYEASIAESPMPTSVACQVIDRQSDPPAVMDALVTITTGVIYPPTVALCHQTTGVGESFRVKPLDPAA
jgi:hypothetical protein